MSAPVAVSSLTIEANSLAVRASGVWLWDLLVHLGSPEADEIMARLELAVHEICMNAVDHAGLEPAAELQLHGSMDASRVTIEIVDQGEPFDEAAVVPPVPGVAQVRGYGLLIVRQLVDDLRYSRQDDVNSWTLIIERHRPTARPLEPRPPGATNSDTNTNTDTDGVGGPPSGRMKR